MLTEAYALYVIVIDFYFNWGGARTLWVYDILHSDHVSFQSLQCGSLNLRVSWTWLAQKCKSSALPLGFLSPRLHGGWMEHPWVCSVHFKTFICSRYRNANMSSYVLTKKEEDENNYNNNYKENLSIFPVISSVFKVSTFQLATILVVWTCP